MARINSTNVIQKAVNDLGLSTSHDNIPTETLDKVQCTYDLNTHFSNFFLGTQSTTTGTLSILVADPKRDFYITNISASYVKDATCDSATGQYTIGVTNNGLAKNFLQFPIITLTAQSSRIDLALSYPLKCDRNTNITFGGAFTVGVLVRNISVIGFYKDSSLQNS